jgi:hypothetical protein
MSVEFTWDDDAKTILRFKATGMWTWNDYHKAVRVASFAVHRMDHAVDLVLDLSETDRIPGGVVAHLRTLGKRQAPAMSDRAVVIGLPHEWRDRMTGGAGSLVVGERTIYFVDSEQELNAALVNR